MRAALGWEIERVDEGQEGLLARVLGQSWQEVYIFLIVFFKTNLYFFLILNLLKKIVLMIYLNLIISIS
jgi:hypothetical protein